jgi:glycine/serine hydroxymethyltransferase
MRQKLFHAIMPMCSRTLIAQANFAVMAAVSDGSGMSLNSGGHLTTVRQRMSAAVTLMRRAYGLDADAIDTTGGRTRAGAQTD